MIVLPIENLKSVLPKPIIAFISFISSFIFLRDFFDEDKHYMSGYLITIVGLFFVLFVWMLVWIVKDYYIPKAKKDTIGVLFHIDTETHSSYKDTVSKLIEEFNRITNYGKTLCFFPIVIPYQRCKKFKPLEKLDIKKYLEKKNCVFYIRVTIKFDKGEQDTFFMMDTAHVVAHRCVDQRFLDILRNEYNYVSSPVVQTEYNLEKKIPALHFRAFQLSYLCQYLCGISLYISEQYCNASIILNELYAQLIKDKDKRDSVKYLMHHLKVWGYLANANLSTHSSEVYLDQQDDALLDRMFEQISIANSYLPDRYEYYLGMAFYLVAKYRDIVQAEKCINRCEEINSNQKWRYSIAFIAAYKNDDCISIFKKYVSAFELSDHNVNRIIQYIEIIIQTTTDRYGLYLALAILYWEYKDNTLAENYYKNFLALVPSKKVITKQLVSCFWDRYEVDINQIETLIEKNDV